MTASKGRKRKMMRPVALANIKSRQSPLPSTPAYPHAGLGAIDVTSTNWSDWYTRAPKRRVSHDGNNTVDWGEPLQLHLPKTLRKKSLLETEKALLGRVRQLDQLAASSQQQLSTTPLTIQQVLEDRSHGLIVSIECPSADDISGHLRGLMESFQQDDVDTSMFDPFASQSEGCASFSACLMTIQQARNFVSGRRRSIAFVRGHLTSFVFPYENTLHVSEHQIRCTMQVALSPDLTLVLRDEPGFSYVKDVVGLPVAFLYGRFDKTGAADFVEDVFRHGKHIDRSWFDNGNLVETWSNSSSQLAGIASASMDDLNCLMKMEKPAISIESTAPH
ncbi:MAG: hypothetical protein M1833_000353 [Piccolia ochrophora]|nr:MAG: hypothetical protein M1833_000353 [Piccolia ochrophora]